MTTWKCRLCGKVVSLMKGGGWTAMPNDWCITHLRRGPHEWEVVRRD